ncbi:hypothetical protein ABK040_002366 [Willaertia magna]
MSSALTELDEWLKFDFIDDFNKLSKNNEELLIKLIKLFKIGIDSRNMYKIEVEDIKKEYDLMINDFEKSRDLKINLINKGIKELENIDEILLKWKDYRNFILQKQLEMNNLLENPKMDKFNKLHNEFKEVSSSLESDLEIWNNPSFNSTEQHASVELNAGKITDKDGNDVWEDRCGCCDFIIQSGAKGERDSRFRCLSSTSKLSVKCCHCHKRVD